MTGLLVTPRSISSIRPEETSISTANFMSSLPDPRIVSGLSRPLIPYLPSPSTPRIVADELVKSRGCSDCSRLATARGNAGQQGKI